MRTLLFILTVFSLSLVSCKRGPGDCGDGKQNGDETSLDCGSSCRLCPPPIAPENANYIIGRKLEVFFIEQKEVNYSNSNFRTGVAGFEWISDGGFYTKYNANNTLPNDSKLKISIGIAQRFAYDTANVPMADDYIARIDSGLQDFAELSPNNEIIKDGFYIQYQTTKNGKDTLYTSYHNPFDQKASLIKVKTFKKLNDSTLNVTGEYQATLATFTKDKKAVIDRGRFNLNFRLKK
jgi:hypothetical protein